jgi:hypothetical protein
MVYIPNHRAIRRVQDGAPERLCLVEENTQPQGQSNRRPFDCAALKMTILWGSDGKRTSKGNRKSEYLGSSLR